MKFLYTAFTYAYVVLLLPSILMRCLLGEREQLERLGFRLRGNQGLGAFWFVASSVGEVNVATKLINSFKSKSSKPVLLTVTTPTGKAQALKNGCTADVILYHPFDIRCAVARFLHAWRPSKIVLVETEIWPTLIEQAFRNSVGVMQVAGRISSRSFAQYRAFKPLFQPLLNGFDSCLMQSEVDAERIMALGARESAVEVLGSPKSDYTPPDTEALGTISDYLAAWEGKKILTCGSTRPGEEEVILEAIAEAVAIHPELKLILAPRHLKRVPEVVRLLESGSLTFVRRRQGAPKAETQALLLDTIGELNLLYHLSAVAFVGGTLVPLGGHNLLEPALAGCPVIYGPHYHNQQPAAALLRKHDLGHVVDDAVSMRDALLKLIESDSRETLKPAVERLRGENASIVDDYVVRLLE